MSAPRARRWARRLGLAAAALVSLLLVASLVARLYVDSDAGQARIRSLASDPANRAIRGRLELGRIELTGVTRVVVYGVKLFDPEGNLVAEVERVELSPKLAGLRTGRLDFRLAKLQRPRLYLVNDARGLNLSRAIKSARPGGPASREPSQVRLEVERLLVEEGYVDLLLQGGDGPLRRYQAEGLSGVGKGSYAVGTKVLRASAQLEGRSTLPLEAPLQISAEASGPLDGLTAQATAKLGAARLVGRFSEEGTERQAFYVDELELPPEIAQALVAQWPLQQTLKGRGHWVRTGNVASLSLDAKAGTSQVEAKGAVDIARWQSDGLVVNVRGVDFSELVKGGLPSNLSAELRFQGGGTTLESLAGTLQLDVPPSQLAGRTLGPVTLRAEGQSGTVRIEELAAVLPGLVLEAGGTARRDSLGINGKVRVSDLSAFAHSLRAVGLEGVPRMAGAGALEFAMDGAADRPGISLSGAVASLRVAEVEVTRSTVRARVPNLRRPLEAEGRFEAKRLRLGERTFEDVTAELTTRGRQLQAKVTTRGLADLVVDATGTLDPDGNGVQLSSLELQYPEARWILKEPSKLAWGEGRISVDRLALQSGAQRLTLSGSKEGRRVKASLEAQAVQLALLPKALVDPALGLSGTLSAQAAVNGSLPRPDGQVRLTLTGATVRKLKGVGLRLEARYHRDRAVGSLQAASVAGTVEGDFDVPVSALLARRPERVSLSLRLGALQVGELLDGLGVALDADGLISGTVGVEGTAEDPQLSLALEGQLLRYGREGHPPLEAQRASLKLASGANSRLGGKLELRALGGEALLALDTPFTLSRLLTQPPTAEELKRTTVGAELELKAILLPLAAAAGLTPKGLGGALSVRASAAGSALAPEGNLLATVEGFTAPGVPPAQATLRVVAGSDSVEASFEGKRKEQRVAQLKARLGAPLSALHQLDTLGAASLDGSADLGPIAFTEVLPPAPAAPGEPEVIENLEGVLAAHLEAKGTLGKPILDGWASVTGLVLGKTPLGKARLSYEYASSKNALDLEFASAGGGGLKAKGQATLELSLPALRRGLAWKEAPIEVGVDADRFDLAFLSGLHPTVRRVGGKLFANARLDGHLGSPSLRGQVEWMEGRLGLLGFGEYRKIHLLLNATADQFELKELVAQAGNGSVRVTATGTRSGKLFRVQGTAETTRFPVVYEDQLFALASLRSTFHGEASARRVEIRELAIPEAHIELPNTKRKDLPSLDRPDDIVLLRDGKRSRRRPRRNGPSPEVAQRPADARQYAITLNAPRNLWVRGSDVQVELGLSEGFRLELSPTQIFGEVRVLRGRAEVIGRRFEVQRGSQLRFAGPPSKPYINLTATYVSEREGVTVNVAISGRGKDLTFKPTSQPPLSESEIYTLLATGRRTLKRGSGATMTGAQAASVVGSLAASQLRNVLAQKLPLDVFSIEAGEEGLEGTRVEAGTYLSDKLYLGYAGELGADPNLGENAHEVRLEYQITPRWSFEAKYGDARAGGADLIWSKDY